MARIRNTVIEACLILFASAWSMIAISAAHLSSRPTGSYDAVRDEALTRVAGTILNPLRATDWGHEELPLLLWSAWALGLLALVAAGIALLHASNGSRIQPPDAPG